MLKALKRVLRDHEVTLASSGRDALDLYDRGERFDVILCDVMMPELTGIDVYMHLQSHYPGEERRIVYISGGAFGEEIVRFLRSVPNQTIPKPFDPDELRGMVAAVAAENIK